MTNTPTDTPDQGTEFDTRRLRTMKQAIAERPALRSEGQEPTRWLRRLVHERRIPHRKVGGRVLVDLADLDRYLEGELIEATP